MSRALLVEFAARDDVAVDFGGDLFDDLDLLSAAAQTATVDAMSTTKLRNIADPHILPKPGSR